MTISEGRHAASGTPLWVFALILAGTLVLALTGMPGVPCIFREISGLPCAGCGLTRSLKALWSGDLLTSLRYHPLGIVLFAACAAALLSRVFRFSLPAFTRKMWISISGMLLIVWVVKLGDRYLASGVFLS